MDQPLTADRWRRIEALFSSLVDLDEAGRASALASMAADDPGLAATVAGMLGHASPGSRLQSVVDAVASGVVGETASPSLPRVGGYRTVREIGRGGMGVVYEGVSDDEFARRVAIKVAPLARLGAVAGARFRLERQILSSLEHPNIARFLDAGAEGDLPYLVMEYVAGAPITAYVQSRRLDLADRLRLVQRLCGALQFAHQRLVVHRDLKPSNILVTDDGTPKLLDFGVAKLLDPGDAPTPTMGVAAWTPDYASPEQVSGELVGTQADIYSLGLVLYEVLTGTRAQVADTTSPLALARSVCETDPPRPSDCAATAGDAVLARRLRGDLDTIVMTAIHKDPARRYVSAAAVADDLERYLAGQPITARPGTAWYRARKWLARHRGGAAAAVLVIMAVGVGLASTLHQARRAERRFQQVRALANEFVFNVHDRIETLPGSTDARRALVQTALTYLENLQADAAGDPGLGKELAAAYAKVGRVQGHPLAANLGDPAAALESYGRAEQLLTPLAAGGDIDATLQLADVTLQIANIRRAGGDLAATLAGFERARQLGERALAARPHDPVALARLGEVNSDIARTATERRDQPTATAAAERAMRASEELAGLDPANATRRNDLATALNALGAARLAEGRLEDAAASYRRAVETREALVRDAPANNEFRRALVVAYGNLGDVLGGRLGQNLGDVAGATDAFQRAVALSRAIAAADVRDRRAAFDLVNAVLRLGAVLADTPGEEARAIPHLEEADRLNQALLAGEAGSDRYRFVQVVIDRRLGRVLNLLDRRDEASRRVARARRDAQTMFDGPNGANARVQAALAAVELATLAARSADARALPAVATARAELASAPVQPLTKAQAHGEIGHALLETARRTPASGRAPVLRLAQDALDASAAGWQAAHLPESLASQRDRAVAQLTADRRTAEALVRP